MKKGFLLVEVMIATAIASMLGMALFMSWDQINRAVVSADDTVNTFDRMMLIRKQFEQDFMGMCLPVSRPYIKEKEEPAAPQQGATPAPQPGNPAQKDAQKKEKPKLVERVFYALNKGEIFESLTCLTNNPLQVYWSDRVGAARPRIARIQYRLEQDPKTEKKPSYTLYRQEAYTLDLDNFKKDSDKAVRSYVLITGIKELKLTYWQEVQVAHEVKDKEADKAAPVPKPGEKPAQKEAKKEWKKELKKVTVWDLEKNPPAKDTFIRPIPTMITVELVLWNMQKKKSRSFVFLIPIPIHIENPEKKDSNEVAAAQETEPAKPTPEAAPAQPNPGAPPTPPAIGAAGASLPIVSSALSNNIQTDVTIIKTDGLVSLKDLLKDEKGMSGKKT